MTDTTTQGTLSQATLAALLDSENGSLTEYAIREQVGSMRAVPWLEKAGLVRVTREELWIEREDNARRMDLVPDVVCVRLAEVR